MESLRRSLVRRQAVGRLKMAAAALLFGGAASGCATDNRAQTPTDDGLCDESAIAQGDPRPEVTVGLEAPLAIRQAPDADTKPRLFARQYCLPQRRVQAGVW